MAVKNPSGLVLLTQTVGQKYTKVTDSSADWDSVDNDTYFYDLSKGLVYYKDLTGEVLGIFSSGGSGGGYVNLILSNQSGDVIGASNENTNYYYIFNDIGTFTLPTAVGNSNQYTVKNRYTSIITINFTSGQNADGSTVIDLQPYQSLTFISDNSNYNIV